eukprot:tig00021332_g20329.t1
MNIAPASELQAAIDQAKKKLTIVFVGDTSVRASVEMQVSAARKTEEVGFFHRGLPDVAKGVDRVFVDHPWFLAKVWGMTGNKLYGTKAGVDYPDNALRFALLCRAALEAPLRGRFPVEFWPALGLPEAARRDLAFSSCFAPPPLDGVSDQRLCAQGIMNGVDVGTWDPQADVFIVTRYGPASVEEGKAANKAVLQARLCLIEPILF